MLDFIGCCKAQIAVILGWILCVWFEEEPKIAWAFFVIGFLVAAIILAYEPEVYCCDYLMCD